MCFLSKFKAQKTVRCLGNLSGRSQGRLGSQVRGEAEDEELAEVRFYSATHVILICIM